MRLIPHDAILLNSQLNYIFITLPSFYIKVRPLQNTSSDIKHHKYMSKIHDMYHSFWSDFHSTKGFYHFLCIYLAH